MNEKFNIVDYLENSGYNFVKEGDTSKCQIINDIFLQIDSNSNTWKIDKLKTDRKTSLDLSKEENLCVLLLVIKLLRKGYSLDSITLEKKWQTGHDPIFLDVMLHNAYNGDIYMIEVKKLSEFDKYTKPSDDKKVKQLLSYAMQERTTKIISFYTYDFDKNKDIFATIFCDELRCNSSNVDEFYDKWNKIFDKSDYIENNNAFSIKQNVFTYETLNEISADDTKNMYNQFLTILRLNSISDKPTAFIRMINLFLSKLADEMTGNKDFSYQDGKGNIISVNGMKFQYIDGEKPESFMKRLNDLYKDGMNCYLRRNVIDYSDSEIRDILGENNMPQIYEVLENLRLKKDVNFSFIEVYDDKTFLENFVVVRDIVRIIGNYKFKYEKKYQFLGDFFENLLNTSLKQEAGQFFTPYPIVDFMVKVLPLEQKLKEKITHNGFDFIPKMIDYACGAGHFLISYMSEMQVTLEKMYKSVELNDIHKKKLAPYSNNPYSWVDDKTIVGIEKDYRLAKTTKIATFLNGDGRAEIISGDGINCFNCEEYQNTLLYSNNKRNEIFDFVISNPPYSVEGFMLNFRKNKITKDSHDFELLTTDINSKAADIETFFVERTEQLLLKNGVGAIILPQSILSNKKYEKMRKFIFDNFRIKVILLTADITFSGTTTSPVILFLEKTKEENLDYDTLVITSPKYKNPAKSLKNKEIEFLGYAFSDNRTKVGIEEIPNSILANLIPTVKSFILNSAITIPNCYEEYMRIVRIHSIILNKTEDSIGDIYPKYETVEGTALSNYCKINNRKPIDFNEDEFPINYLEISDLNTQLSKKKKNTTRLCRKGDILISSLVPTKDKIVVANDNYMLSTAIHVLSDFESDDMRDRILNVLREDSTIKQMHSLLDGFKITYAKITEQNLYNNVLIKI